jgi:hypothetical protein
MALPTRNDKDYLEITGRGKAFSLVAEKRHAEELEALFNGRGLACWRDTGVGDDVLRFDDSVNRAAVEGVLESYKQAKGS